MRAMERIGILIGVFAFAMAAHLRCLDRLDRDRHRVGRRHRAHPRWAARAHDRVVPLDDAAPARGDPSDDPLGDIDEIQGDYGFFSPHSWWPLFLGAAAALCFLGLAVGWWMFIIGAFFAVPALVGWTFEYWKGEHAL